MLQADVPAVQGESVWTRQAGQVHPAHGPCRRRRLSLQVPQLALDGGGQGRPGDAKKDVHPPRLTKHRRAMDVEARLLPQAQTNEQHQRQTRIRQHIRKYTASLYVDPVKLCVCVRARARACVRACVDVSHNTSSICTC